MCQSDGKCCEAAWQGVHVTDRRRVVTGRQGMAVQCLEAAVQQFHCVMQKMPIWLWSQWCGDWWFIWCSLDASLAPAEWRALMLHNENHFKEGKLVRLITVDWLRRIHIMMFLMEERILWLCDLSDTKWSEYSGKLEYPRRKKELPLQEMVSVLIKNPTIGSKEMDLSWKLKSLWKYVRLEMGPDCSYECVYCLKMRWSV